jgi:hypothetical protein
MNRAHTTAGWLIPSLAVVVLLGAVTAGFFYLQWKATTQRQAVRAIHRLGGWAFYDSRYDEKGNLVAAWPRGPRWAIRLLGVDFFGTVTGVVLGPGRPVEGLPDFGLIDHNIPVKDEHLAILEDLPYLEWLVLAGTQITDSGLAHLRHLRRLRWLWLNDTQITDAGFEHLAQLPSLEKLYLDGTQIEGRTALLNRFSNLCELSVQHTRFSDHGLRQLKEVTQLKRLRLANTPCSFATIVEVFVNGQGRSLEEALVLTELASVDNAGQIVALNLSGRQVRDEDLSLLKTFQKLQWLYLAQNPITDLGLRHLTRLPKLSLIDLSGTSVSFEGIKTLFHLPGLNTLHLEGVPLPPDVGEQILLSGKRVIRIYRGAISSSTDL